MRNLTLSLLLICCVLFEASAQKKDLSTIENAIVSEAKVLYNSEWASWYGTDIFMVACKEKANTQGGYLSYDDGKGLINIFYSKDSIPEVIATISFGYDLDQSKYRLDTLKRSFNKQEKELYSIRLAALTRINSDTTFKHYNNTTLNPVPMVYNGKKKVYVLTGTNLNDVVIFGNDYLIEFNGKNQISGVTKLHNSIIPIYLSNKNETDTAKTIVASMHSHLRGKDEFITVTDICTIMLYAKFTTWRTCYVMSDTYVSIWDVNKRDLVIMTRGAWDNVGKNEKAGKILGKPN